MIKEHDYFLELMSNPTFGPKDFLLAGINSENTSILDKSKYKNASIILNDPLFLTNGKFDEAKFDKIYNGALAQYNELTRLSSEDAPFGRNDIFAPETLRAKGPEFTIQKVANPLRLQESFVHFGIKEAPTKSVREIALGKPVYDYKTKTWIDSPNDNWWDNFLNPKVLAQWDFDADENGNPTSDPNKIVFHKGEKKIDPTTGTYFYETLGGRSVYGRDVLSGFDTLTRDGSVANKFDFLDSDDLEKSFRGTVAKTVAQIAPVFIPYVGEAYIATRVGLSLSQLFPVISKVFTGSDNSFMSHIEGINKAFSFSISDYSQGSEEAGTVAKTVTWENSLKMIADVFTQLAELRWIFKYGSAAFSNISPKMIGETEAAKAAREAYIQKESAKYGFDVSKLLNPKLSAAEKRAKIEFLNLSNFHRAKRVFDDKFSKGLELSKYLSIAYMTGITTADSYGEAKLLGASDLEAALFALGYAAAEYRLLSSDLGQWILPELKMEKFGMKLSVKLLAEPLKRITEENKDLPKKTLFKKLFDYGKSIAKQDFSESVIGNTVKMTASSMLSEGVEETSEELLLDVSKLLFNIANSLRGDDTKFDDVWENMAARYGMSFAGGLIGGGIATALPGYKAARAAVQNTLSNTSNSEAYKQVVHYLANGKGAELRKIILNTNFGSKDLSMIEISDATDQNGVAVYKPAEKYEDSQDYHIKKLLLNQLDIIEGILETEGAKITDGQLTDALIRKDLRYGALLGSNVLGVYTNEFAQLREDLVNVTGKIIQLEAKKNGTADPFTGETPTDGEINKEKRKWSDEDEKELIEAKKLKEDIRKKFNSYLDGTMADEFRGEALFEMDPRISSAYASTDMNMWMEKELQKEYKDISPEEYKTMKARWLEGNINRREIIHLGYLIFKKNQKALKDIIEAHEESYFTTKNVINEIEKILLGEESAINNIKDNEEIITKTQEFIPGKSLILIWGKLLESLKGQISDDTYNDFDNAFRNMLKSFEEYIGVENLKDITIDEVRALENTNPEAYQKILKAYNIENEINYASSEELLEILTNGYEKALKNYENNSIYIALNILNFLSNEEVLKGILKKLQETKYITPSTKTYFKQFFNSVGLPKNIQKKYIEAVENIKYSPVEELLKNMKLRFKENGVDVTGMVTEISTLLLQLSASQSVSAFSYDSDTAYKIAKTLDLLDLAFAHLEAAKTELTGESLDDLFGYNVTVNKLGKYKWAEIKSSTANVLLLELARLKTDLIFYLKIYATNTDSKLNEHIKTELRLNSLYYGHLKNWSVAIPDEFKDKEKILLAVDNAEIMKKVHEENLTELSLEDRKKLFKERTLIESNIYQFFLTNSDKLTPEKIALLFNNDKYAIKVYDENWNKILMESVTSILNSETKTEPDHDFLSYIASIASADPHAVLNEYKEIIDGTYAPVIALEEAMRRAIAFLMGHNTYTLFGLAYNEIYKSLMQKEIGDNLDYDSATYLLSFRHFLIEGIAGSGKTTAIYETLAKILFKYHPKLLENVWVVSNSLENAKKLAQSFEKIGIKVTYMSKGKKGSQILDSEGKIIEEETPYFERIAEGYNQEFNSDGTIKITRDELVEDDKEIPHYKNTVLRDVKPPSIVFFDEVSSMSQQDLLLSEDFLNKYNVNALVAGDFDLIGAEGNVILRWNSDGTPDFRIFDENGIVTSAISRVSLAGTNFMGTFKLGSSIRSNNKYKSLNNSIAREAITSISKNFSIFNEWENPDASDENILKNGPYNKLFNYYESFNPANRGLYGDKFVVPTDKSIEKSVENMLQAIKAHNERTGELEKLNFIYDNSESDLYKLLKSFNESAEYKNLINFVSASASQGLEGMYYVAELTSIFEKAVKLASLDGSSTPQTLLFAKTLYTAISRAKQGTLIVGDFSVTKENLEGVTVDSPQMFSSVEQESLQVDNLALEVLNTFASTRKEIIEAAELNPDAKMPEPEKRSSSGTEETKPPIPSEIVSGEEYSEDEETMKEEIDSDTGTASGITIENNDEKKLSMSAHTFMCYETGCTLDSDKTMDPMDENVGLILGEYTEDRIDNINGLIKLNKFKGKVDSDNPNRISGENKIYLLNVLNGIRHAATYLKGRDAESNLIEYLKNVLFEFDEKKPDIQIQFGYKDVNRGNDPTIGESKEESKAKRRFFKGVREWLLGIINPSNKNSDIRKPDDKEIVLVVADSNGKKLLEVNIAKMTSYLSLLESPGFEDLKTLYEQNKDDFKGSLKTALKNNQNIPHLKLIAYLVELFEAKLKNGGGNTMIFIPNEFIFNTTLSGLMVTATERGIDYKNNNKLFYKAEYIDLDVYRKMMPWRKISLVYASAENKPVKIGNTTLLPGKEFVLVSDFYNNDSDELLYLKFIKQEKNNGPKYIKLVYVSPPLATIDEHLFNLYSSLKKVNIDKIDSSIGSASSAFHLLKMVVENKEFDELYKKEIGEAKIKRYENLKALIEELSELSPSDLYKVINSPTNKTVKLKSGKEFKFKSKFGQGGKYHGLAPFSDNYKLRYLFLGYLLDLIFKDLSVLSGTIKHAEISFNNGIIEIANDSDYLKNKLAKFKEIVGKKWPGVNYHLKFKSSDTGGSLTYEGVTIGQIDTSLSEYKVSGRPIRINGKIDSTQLIFDDITPMLEWILKGMGKDVNKLSNKKDTIFVTDNDSPYKRGHYKKYVNDTESIKLYTELSENQSEFRKFVNSSITSNRKNKLEIRKLLNEAFDNLSEEEQSLILENPLPFIYLITKQIPYKTTKNGTDKWALSMDHNSEKIIFTENGPIFLNNSEVVTLTEKGLIANLSLETFNTWVEGKKDPLIKEFRELLERTEEPPKTDLPKTEPNSEIESAKTLLTDIFTLSDLGLERMITDIKSVLDPKNMAYKMISNYILKDGEVITGIKSEGIKILLSFAARRDKGIISKISNLSEDEIKLIANLILGNEIEPKNNCVF